MKNLSFIILLFCISCSTVPDQVRETLDFSGHNRIELEKVIEHFKKSNDQDKLKAAYFLIGNMKNKYSYNGSVVRKFDKMFEILDSLHKNKIKFGNSSPLVQQKWDSLVGIYGFPTKKKAEVLDDPHYIRSTYLINHIDESFKVWKKTKWKLNFHQFCMYILPYRIGTERLEQWQKSLFKEYELFRDTTKAKNRYDYTTALNMSLRMQKFNTNHTLWSYPFGIPASIMKKSRVGACQHLVAYTAMVMRSNGLPIGIDEVALWGNRGMGHSWNTLLMEDGKMFPFDASKDKLGGHKMFIYKFAKAYRQTFENIKRELPGDTSDIPSFIFSENKIDVTHEYTKTYNISIPIKFSLEQKKKHALICTFDNKNWVPQDWGKIENDEVKFKNMGSDILYLAMYYHNGAYYPLNTPFVLTKNGKLNFISGADQGRQEMQLLRKYPIFDTQIKHLSTIIGGQFQGANKSDFSDSVELFRITQMPEKLERISIDNPKAFRYIRYVAPEKKPAIISELEFYTDNKNDPGNPLKLNGKIMGSPAQTEYLHKNAFDGKLETYYNSGKNKPHSWIGLDLLKPQKIVKIGYCPSNDSNFIIVGDTYELSYWHKDRWKSIEKKVATDQLINYSNVPAGQLYILRNLNGGKENRIFTYEVGKQVWW